MTEKKLEADWIINLKNGKSIHSDSVPKGFLELAQTVRDDISAMRLIVGDKTLTISAKDEEGNKLNGFFYHLKEGITRVFKTTAALPSNLPFVAERFGFCYNAKGDSYAIRIDHMNYWRELKLQNENVFELEDQLKTELDSNKRLQIMNHVAALKNKAIKYPVNIDRYKENIVEKRVAVALFGKLENLPEELDTLPTVTETAEEVISG